MSVSGTGHGGRREGAGRHPLPPAQRRKPVTIWLSNVEAYWCELLGKGNRSAGARILISDALRRMDPDPEIPPEELYPESPDAQEEDEEEN